MMDGKTAKFISEIYRGIGMIEGVSYGLDEDKAQPLVDAVATIEEAVKELAGWGK